MYPAYSNNSDFQLLHIISKARVDEEVSVGKDSRYANSFPFTVHICHNFQNQAWRAGVVNMKIEQESITSSAQKDI